MPVETLFTLTPFAVAAIPVTVGLVAVLKGIGLPSRWAPVASIALGALLISLIAPVWQVIVAQGIIVGLSASGLWSGAKATFQG